MKVKKLLIIAAFVTSLGTASGTTSAQGVLTGDTGLACEAVLCIAGGSWSGQCSRSIRKYFSFTGWRFRDIIKKRLKFLKLCPIVGQSTEMSELIEATVDSAGRCDAKSLNIKLLISNSDSHYISDEMPNFCKVFIDHTYTNFDQSDMPRYVGWPNQGGYWVEAADYDQALIEYNQHLEAERARLQAER